MATDKIFTIVENIATLSDKDNISKEFNLIKYKDLKNNILYVAHGSEDRLYSKGLIMNEINWIPYKPQGDVIECTGKFRYRQPEQKCRIIVKENGYEVEFEEKQRAITEGQFAVFYQEEKCIGGGVIEKAIF